MRSSRLLLKILGAIALGIFFSCAPNNPDPLYPQNRNVLTLVCRDLTKGATDSILNATYPDSLSGWRLAWELPEGSGLNGVYIFADTIPDELAKSRLVSGSGSFDPNGLPKLWAALGPKDTTWEIPSLFFAGKQGRSVRSDTAYSFYVWLRFDKDVAGLPVRLRVYLGDESHPVIPLISDSIGQTNAVLRVPRPSDQTSVFDTLRQGPLSRVEVRWWPGSFPSDSSKDSGRNVASIQVPQSQLSDRSFDTFRLELKPLRYFTRYMYMVIATDSVGLRSFSTPVPFTTSDSLLPSSPGLLDGAIRNIGTLDLTWEASSDSFDAGGLALVDAFPNHRIASYTVRFNGVTVDSLNLSAAGGAPLGAGATWQGTGPQKRFRWSGDRWHWTWPNLEPGARFSFTVSSRDSSGNDSRTAARFDSVAPLAATFACSTGFVPVKGSGALGDFCIEPREHRVGSSVKKAVTWAEAISICSEAGAFLCSDSQWVRACESSPSGQILPYGSIETGALDGSDSLGWLSRRCQLGTGDSTGLALSTSDTRCMSGWGVFDMSGGVAEWTRDVYHSNPAGGGKRDANLAWIDTSDLTRKADLGTIHGGSWLKLDQFDRTLASARCRERNYPAFSGIFDTLPGGVLRRRANPAGFSSGVGFRCCKPPK
jgi:hypothetical protein